MKLTPYFLIVIALFSCNRKSSTEKTPISVNCTLKRSYDSIYNYLGSSKRRTFDVKLSIVNNSDSSTGFWIMKCSWQDNLIISDYDFSFVRTECNGNFPSVKYLKSGDSITYEVSIISHIIIGYNNTSDFIKFGLILIDEKKYTSDDEYLSVMHDKSRQDKVVWSNSINLNSKP